MSIRFDKTTGKFLSRTTFGSSANDWTYLGWVYVVTKPANGSYYGVVYKEMFSNANAAEFTSVSNNLRLTLWDGANETGTTTLSTTTWYHVAIVRESSTVFKLYINGSLDHTGGTNALTLKDGISRLGCWDTSTDNADIRMAGWKIYGAGLTASEVAQEMYTLAPRRYANLIGFLPMLPGSAERARDYSGLGNNYTENGTLTDEDPPPVSWGGRSRKKIFIGGTTFTQSINATEGNSFTLIRSAGKVVAISNTPTFTKTALVNKTLSYTAPNTATAVKQTGKSISASNGTTATITKIITFVKSIAASVSNTATIARQINKVVSASASNATTFVKAVSKTIAVSTASTFSQLKNTFKSVFATETNTVTQTRLTNKVITSSVSSVTTFVKQVNKVITAAVSNIVSIATQFISGGGAVFTQTINATLGNTTTFVRNVNKFISSTGTQSTTFARQMGKTVTISASSATTSIKNVFIQALASSTSAVTRNIITFKNITSISTYTFSISNLITKTIQITLPVQASVVKGLFQTITANTTTIAAIVTQVVFGIVQTFYRNAATITLNMLDRASSVLTPTQTGNTSLHNNADTIEQHSTNTKTLPLKESNDTEL